MSLDGCTTASGDGGLVAIQPGERLTQGGAQLP